MISHDEIKLYNYIKIDLYRAFCSWRFVVGVLGVFFTLVIATFQSIKSYVSVIHIYYIIVYGMPFIITLIFSTLPYAGCFCDDFENKYISIQIIRGKASQYVFSKIVVIFISSIITITLGTFLYVCFLRCLAPWVSNESIYEYALTSGGFRTILKRGYFIIYYILFGMQFGILAGILSMIASYISLYIYNRLLVLSLPIMSFYFIDYFINLIFGEGTYNLNAVFSGSMNIWDNDLYSFLFALIIGILSLIIIYILTYRKIERTIENG